MSSILAVIPAAGPPSNRILNSTTLPDAMIPINGKPVIGYILDDLLERKIRDCVIVLHQDDKKTEKYVQSKFSQRFKRLDFKYNKHPDKGIGHSIRIGIKNQQEYQSVYVCLGDTIYKGKLHFSESFVVTAKDFDVSINWSFVDDAIYAKQQHHFLHKPVDYQGTGHAIVGVYYFHDINKLQQAIADISLGKIEIVDILNHYQKRDQFNLVQSKRWYDCGNIENYYKAKIDFVKIRSFNQVVYDDAYGVITKKSHDHNMIAQEVGWYENVPKSLQIFAPRLVNSDINSDFSSYTLEYYGYQTLSDYYLFSSLHPKVWQIIINKLFEIVHLFSEQHRKIPLKAYKTMYVDKTYARLEQLKLQDSYWQDLLAYSEIIINGEVYPGLPHYWPKIDHFHHIIYDPQKSGVLHGDLHLSNILFDPGSKLFKLIDPRGNFGVDGIYGDCQYDVGKLRHSFHGQYDFIISDLFTVHNRDNEFELHIFQDQYHKNIALYFDQRVIDFGWKMSNIKLIEAILFLSMLPLHHDNRLRQNAMFCIAIKNLKEYENENSI